MTNKYKKIISVGALLFLVFGFFIAVNFAHAQAAPTAASGSSSSGWSLFSLGNIAYTIVGKTIFAVTYFIALIGGVLVAIASWAVSVFLQINVGIVNSNVVQYGFPVTLAIANLGFVLAIIIIAIATILRQQTYGIKTMLYKVVIMAVLVNFGLILAGGILNFSDSLSTSFVENISPAGSGNSYGNFASSLAGAFNPQKAFLFGTNSASSTIATGGNASLTAQVGSNFGAMLLPAISSIFALGAIAIILLTLVTLIVMLIIRYVYLGILLILLPIAWMLWIFPTFKKHWDSWWNNFLKYAFFPPVVLFFLWLGLRVASAMASGAGGTFNITSYESASSNPAWSAVSTLLTNIGLPAIQSFMQIVMLGGIMMGGLFAANSLGIKFADTSMKLAKKGRDGVLGYTGRVTRRAITAPARSEAGKNLAQNLMQTKLTGVAGYGAKLLGRGLSAYQRVGGENLVAEYEKKYAGMSEAQLTEEITSPILGNSPQSMAGLLKNLQKKKKGGIMGTFDEKTGRWSNGLTAEQYQQYAVGEANKNTFARIGQSQLWKELNTFNANTAEEGTARLAEAAGAIGAPKESKDALVKSLDKLVSSLGKDSSKVDFQSLFSGKAQFGLSTEATRALAGAWARSMAKNNPALAAAIIPKLKADSVNNFNNDYTGAMNEELSEAKDKLSAAKTDPEKQAANDIIEKIKENQKRFQKSVANNAIFGGAGASEEGEKEEKPAPAPSPQPQSKP